jgi:thiol-disulfide isomerase/thioredoxin
MSSSINFYNVQPKPVVFEGVEQVDSKRLEEIIKTGNLSILDVFADWCQPCKYVSPKFEELSKEFPRVQFMKVNLEDLDLHQQKVFSITALPTFLIFKEGRILEKIMGANIRDVSEKLKKYV